MEKKLRAGILLLAVYLLVFWIGFKSGGSYSRTKHFEMTKAMFQPPQPAPVENFYVVTRIDYGSYKAVSYERVDKNNVIMGLFANEKLRPLLKLRDMEIYRESGERIY